MKPLLITAFAIVLNLGIALLPGQTVFRQMPTITTPKPLKMQFQPMGTLDVIPISAQDYAHIWLKKYGWEDQWDCLNNIITHESGWRVTAYNPSGATGLGQALPASKMAAFGDDYLTNPSTQVHWMMDYISRNHGGTPCSNWAFWQSPTSPPYGQHWY